MDTIASVVDFANQLIWNTPESLPFMVILLLFTGLFLTVRLGFVQFRRMGHSIRTLLGHFDDPNDEGDVSHFQALSSALSATVGIGNIAGVATAIHYGGPGAVFWLWLTGFIGMASKFAECTLAQKYRVIHPDGSVSGGPMYYMEKAFGPKWKWLGIVFAGAAVISSFGSGNAIQAFTMADSFRSEFGIPNWISGLVSAALVGLVILGGIKRIGAVTAKLAPFMASLYVLAGLIIVILNFDRLPGAVATIVEYAFDPPGMIGGFAGSTFVFTLTWGIKRGLFSNEAGQGSAPIAHAAARTDEPVREGAVALMEPFIDTVVICFMTGLIIVVTGTWNEKHPEVVDLTPKSSIDIVESSCLVGAMGKVPKDCQFIGEAKVADGKIKGVKLIRSNSIMEDVVLQHNGHPFTGTVIVSDNGITLRNATGQLLAANQIKVHGKTLLNGSPLTAKSFEHGLAPLFPRGNLLITLSVFLFAISTAISWSYYGDRAVMYLFGPRAVLPYKLVFTGVHFLGAIFSLEVVWGFGDAALGMMAIPNLITLIILAKSVRKDSDKYFARMDKVGIKTR